MKVYPFPHLKLSEDLWLDKIAPDFLMSFAGGFTDSEEYKVTCSGHEANDFYGE